MIRTSLTPTITMTIDIQIISIGVINIISNYTFSRLNHVYRLSTVNSLLWARQGTETTIISHALLSLDELPWDVPALGDSHHYTVDCFSYVSLSPGRPVHHINLIFISIVFLISLGGSQIELKHFDFYQGLQEQNYFHFFWGICVYISLVCYNIISGMREVHWGQNSVHTRPVSAQ